MFRFLEDMPPGQRISVVVVTFFLLAVVVFTFVFSVNWFVDTDFRCSVLCHNQTQPLSDDCKDCLCELIQEVPSCEEVCANSSDLACIGALAMNIQTEGYLMQDYCFDSTVVMAFNGTNGTQIICRRNYTIQGRVPASLFPSRTYNVSEVSA